jgi:hypothetical protein
LAQDARSFNAGVNALSRGTGQGQVNPRQDDSSSPFKQLKDSSKLW